MAAKLLAAHRPFPGTCSSRFVSGTCGIGRRSPRPVPFPPQTPQKVSFPCSAGPQVKNTGAAVVVFPGGGYESLAIDLEGTEVCDWLTSNGITCVLLKYRVPPEALYPKSASYRRSGPYPKSQIALEDEQRTAGLVRFHAA